MIALAFLDNISWTPTATEKASQVHKAPIRVHFCPAVIAKTFQLPSHLSLLLLSNKQAPLNHPLQPAVSEHQLLSSPSLISILLAIAAHPLTMKLVLAALPSVMVSTATAAAVTQHQQTWADA